jgi:hypothetical protein
MINRSLRTGRPGAYQSSIGNCQRTIKLTTSQHLTERSRGKSAVITAINAMYIHDSMPFIQYHSEGCSCSCSLIFPVDRSYFDFLVKINHAHRWELNLQLPALNYPKLCVSEHCHMHTMKAPLRSSCLCQLQILTLSLAADIGKVSLKFGDIQQTAALCPLKYDILTSCCT